MKQNRNRNAAKSIIGPLEKRSTLKITGLQIYNSSRLSKNTQQRFICIFWKRQKSEGVAVLSLSIFTLLWLVLQSDLYVVYFKIGISHPKFKSMYQPYVKIQRPLWGVPARQSAVKLYTKFAWTEHWVILIFVQPPRTSHALVFHYLCFFDVQMNTTTCYLTSEL